MLTRKFLMMFLCGTLCLGAVSCSKDDDDDSSSGCADIEEAIEAEQERVEEAYEEYEDDDSDDNCEALEDAYDNYINKIESLLDCPDLDNNDEEYLEELLDEAEEEKQYLCNGGVDPSDCGDIEVVVEEEQKKVEEAFEEFENDDSDDNCVALQNAFDNYINTLETLLDCPDLDVDDEEYLEELLDEAEEEKQNLCSGGGETPSDCDTGESIEDELIAFEEAQNDYTQNPTSANCTAYKNAYHDYIDALKPYVNCPGLTAEEREEFQEYLEQAEAQIEFLCE